MGEDTVVPGCASQVAADDDLHDLRALDVTNQSSAEIRDGLMEQLSTIGFLVLTNVPDYDEAEFLRACKALHALPAEVKRTLYLTHDEPRNSNRYRGYHPFKANDASHKEFLDVGLPIGQLDADERGLPLYEETPWPAGAEHAWIRERFEQTFASWYALALRVVRLLAEGLGKPADFFDAWFAQGSLSTFRSIHYLPRSAALVDSSQLSSEDARLTTPPHADSGFLTFLATFGYPGLQVLVDGVYKSVAPVPPNTLVVNVGDTFSRLTGYRLKATFHQVVDTGAERFSAPLFLEPKYSARIPAGLLSGDRARVDLDLPADAPWFGDWLVRRMKASWVEWRDFEVPADRADAVAAIRLNDFRNSPL